RRTTRRSPTAMPCSRSPTTTESHEGTPMGLHLRRIIAITGGLAVVGTLAPIASLPTRAAAASPLVSVSPHTDLKDRDQVAVSGVGFAPSHTVVVTQCAPT